ncbi:CoA pyrophosphatase [Pseudomonadota bacterium]
MSHWRELLLEAVSPLDAGVRHLEISGYRPPGDQVFRPSRTAAVLVPLLDLPEPEIVFTRRSDHLPHHPGQVSFPGGAAEEDDVSAVQTALREAFEEIGLPRQLTRPVGFLDRMDTISDYRVLPVVALVTPPVSWVLDEREVAEVFTVPLSVVLDVEQYEARSTQWQGNEYTLYTLHWQGQKIWGVTAAMLMNLIQRMQTTNEKRNSRLSSTTQ